MENTVNRIEIFDDCMEDKYKECLTWAVRDAWAKRTRHDEPIKFLRQILTETHPEIVWGTSINR